MQQKAQRAERNFSVKSLKALLRVDVQRATERIRQYREQMSLCETIGVFTIAERIRDVLQREQEHLVELASALRVGAPRQARAKSTNPCSGSVCTSFTRA
jgi:bacterioferritin (cytochrome b1)